MAKNRVRLIEIRDNHGVVTQTVGCENVEAQHNVLATFAISNWQHMPAGTKVPGSAARISKAFFSPVGEGGSGYSHTVQDVPYHEAERSDAAFAKAFDRINRANAAANGKGRGSRSDAPTTPAPATATSL